MNKNGAEEGAVAIVSLGSPNSPRKEVLDGNPPLKVFFVEVYNAYNKENEQHDIICGLTSNGLDDTDIVYCQLLKDNNVVYHYEKRAFADFTWYPRISAARAKRLAPELFEHKTVQEWMETYGEQTYFEHELPDDGEIPEEWIYRE